MKYYSYSFPDEGAKKAFVVFCEDQFRDSLDKAAEAALRQSGLRFIALSGPTCSGKTTTAGIFIEKLKATGKGVRVISIDDFFLDRTILAAEAEKSGMPIDLDSVKAIDIGELRHFVDGIERGEPLRLPVFDFTSGKRSGYTELHPTENDLFIFEGIQAVYPEVTSLFDPSHLLKIYISVENGIDTPYGNWLPREIRLLRRIVRDSRIRNTDAETTFAHWSGVTANELANIEPYKDGCDIKIDSGMAYEIGVMRKPLISLLEQIKENSPYYLKAKMLTEKLRDFPDIEEKYVPGDSVLREFIG